MADGARPAGEDDAPIEGGVADRGWEGVERAFRENFARRGEVGASLCVIHRGEVVVDLSGGWADFARTRPYRRDDLALVFSTTKAMTALSAHVLADRGALDLHAPVSDYWPEYAASGKAATTVAMLLNHSAGVPGFHEPLKPDAHLDWTYMVERLAAEPPFWEPGSRNGYHPLNFGWLVGEVVRRVSGASLGRFFRDEVSGPLDADFWIGLPQEHEHRTVELAPTLPKPGEAVIEVYSNLVEHPDSASALTFTNAGGFSPAAVDPASGAYIMNTRAVHAAEIGGAGGVGSARGIARIYAALATGAPISRDHVVRMSQTSMVSQRDPILLVPTRFALGFMKSVDNRRLPLGEIESFIIGRNAFGHVGAGGSFGFHDPEAELSIGYTMNRLGQGVLLDARGQSLIDAAYVALGYRTNAPGVWIR